LIGEVGMGTKAGVGFSFHRDPAVAGKEAAAKALQQAEIAEPDFVFVFATVGYDQEALIRAVREATSSAPLSGCSGEGIITQETVIETNFAVSVMAIRSDELRFRNARVKETAGDSEDAGIRLAEEVKPLLTGSDVACFLFADGLVFNFDPFVAKFEQSLPRDNALPLVGGLAADNWTSRKTYQYYDDEVFSEGISCVVMSGKGEIACGINHGCLPVGTRRTITRSSGNVIFEIDGIPAIEALAEYFEEDWKSNWNKTTLNLCLGFKAPEEMKQNYEEYIIRYIVGKNDNDGSITIQSEIREGTELWLVRRDKELIAGGIRTIAQQIKSAAGARKPKFVLQFECVGRGKVMFREREKVELIKALQNEIGNDIPWIGFYTYGEIGPVTRCNCFHNFTSVVAAAY
jgi:hypothetical protein